MSQHVSTNLVDTRIPGGWQSLTTVCHLPITKLCLFVYSSCYSYYRKLVLLPSMHSFPFFLFLPLPSMFIDYFNDPCIAQPNRVRICSHNCFNSFFTAIHRPKTLTSTSPKNHSDCLLKKRSVTRSQETLCQPQRLCHRGPLHLLWNLIRITCLLSRSSSKLWLGHLL